MDYGADLRRFDACPLRTLSGAGMSGSHEGKLEWEVSVEETLPYPQPQATNRKYLFMKVTAGIVFGPCCLIWCRNGQHLTDNVRDELVQW